MAKKWQHYKLITSIILILLVIIYLASFDPIPDQPISDNQEKRQKIIAFKLKSQLAKLQQAPYNTLYWLELSDLYLYNKNITKSLTALKAAESTLVDDEKNAKLAKLIAIKFKHIQTFSKENL